MKGLGIFIAAVVMVSCEIYVPLGNEEDYMASLTLPEFSTGTAANIFVYSFLRYTSDPIEGENYFCSPREMLEEEAIGDCEDYCILLACILKYNFGTEPLFILVRENGVGHCLLMSGSTVYDPTAGTVSYYYSRSDIPGYEGYWCYDYVMAQATDGWRK